jgi:predicted RND superfamily exporter protein
MLGAMGWAGIPLGVATSMFCAITFGVGSDNAIHLLERVRRHADPTAVAREVADVGPPVAADALAAGLGFAVLMFSSVPASARLGGFVALTLLVSLVLTLGGLGAFMVLRSRGRVVPAGSHEAAGRDDGSV